MNVCINVPSGAGTTQAYVLAIVQTLCIRTVSDLGTSRVSSDGECQQQYKEHVDKLRMVHSVRNQKKLMK